MPTVVYVPKEVTSSVTIASWLLNQESRATRPKRAFVWDDRTQRAWELQADRHGQFHASRARAQLTKAWSNALKHYAAWQLPTGVVQPVMLTGVMSDGAYRTAQHDVLDEVDRLASRLRWVRWWRNNCSAADATCPVIVIDVGTRQERLRQPTDQLSDCQSWACTMEELERDNQTFREAALTGIWRGLSSTSDGPVTVMTLDDMILLGQHVRHVRMTAVPQSKWLAT
jgi:hypothetical protein